MAKLDQERDEMNLSLFEIITSHDVEDQCTKIANWFNQIYHLDGIGFFLKNAGTTRTYFYTETVPKYVVQGLEEIHLGFEQTNEAGDEFLFFGQKEEKLNVFSPQEHPYALVPIGLISPLTVKGHSFGTMAMVTSPAEIQDLTAKKQALLSLITPRVLPVR